MAEDEKTRMFDQLAAAIDEKRAEARKTAESTPWAELSTADKMERLREVVKKLQRVSDFDRLRIQEINSHVDALGEHGHLDGKVVIPVLRTSAYGEGGGSGQKAEKVEGWF